MSDLYFDTLSTYDVAVQLLQEMNIRPDDGRVMLVYK